MMLPAPLTPTLTCMPLQAGYARRAEAAQQAAAACLEGLATWQAPAAGMFLWFKLTGEITLSPWTGLSFFWQEPL